MPDLVIPAVPPAPVPPPVPVVAQPPAVNGGNGGTPPATGAGELAEMRTALASLTQKVTAAESIADKAEKESKRLQGLLTSKHADDSGVGLALQEAQTKADAAVVSATAWEKKYTDSEATRVRDGRVQSLLALTDQPRPGHPEQAQHLLGQLAVAYEASDKAKSFDEALPGLAKAHAEIKSNSWLFAAEQRHVAQAPGVGGSSGQAQSYAQMTTDTKLSPLTRARAKQWASVER